MADDDRDAWDRFVESCEQATFYHLSGWRTVIEEALGHACAYFLCERNREILGVLPLARVKSLFFGDVLVSMPFLVYGGVAATDPQAADLLIEGASIHARELQVDHLELRHRDGPIAGWPEKSTHVTFRKRIDADPDSNLRAIPRKQRAMVRKGIAGGLTSRRVLDPERLHRIMLECKRNLGTPFFSARYLKKITETFSGNTEITMVSNGAKDVAGVMSFRFRDEILPYYGGSLALARKLYANDFMYWEVMRRACSEGARIFDYGRSQIDSGAYRFKKHWGFEPQPLHYECLAVEREVVTLTPGGSKYRVAVDLWKRLPLPVAGLIGPRLARLLY